MINLLARLGALLRFLPRYALRKYALLDPWNRRILKTCGWISAGSMLRLALDGRVHSLLGIAFQLVPIAAMLLILPMRVYSSRLRANPERYYPTDFR